jgi:uncharacterized protein with FMN-binding domain
MASAWTITSLNTAHAATTGKAATATTTTIKGPVEQTQQWGPIQVSLILKKKHISAVKVSAVTHTTRSSILQGGAIQILKSETLTAQSANINTVSGATDTSDAYIQSLQGAITKARAAKALK